jgi:hypothetical protein
MSVDRAAYDTGLRDQGVLLDNMKSLGFREMDYRVDLWPPCHESDAYLCVPTQGFTRSDNTKWFLVPILKGTTLKMHRPWLKERVRYHQDEHGRPTYGKR